MSSHSRATPPEIAAFLEKIPLFEMVEFSAFPERRITPEDWPDGQEEMLSADPASTTLRALTDLPSGEMLVIDLDHGEEGYPLSVAELGLPEDAQPLNLTLSGYLDLAAELSPLERQMHDGRYPFDAIVAAFERRGLHENDYWSDSLAYLEESREETEHRMRHIRDDRA